TYVPFTIRSDAAEMTVKAVWHRAEPATFTTTWPGPACGSGTSWNSGCVCAGQVGMPASRDYSTRVRPDLLDDGIGDMLAGDGARERDVLANLSVSAWAAGRGAPPSGARSSIANPLSVT